MNPPPFGHGLIWLLLVFALPQSGFGEDRFFRLTKEAVLTSSVGNHETETRTKTILDFRWKVEGKTRTLFLIRLAKSWQQNGVEVRETNIDAKSIESSLGERKEVIEFEKAPIEMRRLMEDTFQLPLCRIELDSVGGEADRVVLAGKGADFAMKDGVVDGITFFLAPYFKEQKSWKTIRQLPVGYRAFVTGQLSFTAEDNKKGLQLFRVSGLLQNPKIEGAEDKLNLRDVKQEISGSMLYDGGAEEWIKAELVVNVSMIASSDEPGAEASKTEGAVKIELRPLEQSELQK